MTINTLIERLQALVAEDEFRGDAEVVFSPAMEPILGGIFARHWETGLVVFNLAPSAPDRFGQL